MQALKDPSFSREEIHILYEQEHSSLLKEAILGNKSRAIKGDDKQMILVNAQYWYDLIFKLLRSQLFSTLSEDSMSKLFPKTIKDKLDSDSREDIDDGVLCVIYSLPTPAVMILFRVVERELRRYVKTITGRPLNRWDDNVEELKNSKIADKSITKEFAWLKEKRNEAEHPDKRYTQDEAEGILHHVSDLMKAIYTKKESI